MIASRLQGNCFWIAVPGGVSAEHEHHSTIDDAVSDASSSDPVISPVDYANHLQAWSAVRGRANAHCQSFVHLIQSPSRRQSVVDFGRTLPDNQYIRTVLTVFCRDTTDGEPQPPCLRCRKENKQCVIGSSNRGGRRVRRSTIASQQAQQQTQTSTQPQAQARPQVQKTDSNDESVLGTPW